MQKPVHNPCGVFGTLRGERLFDAISGCFAAILAKMWRQNAASRAITPRNPREPPCVTWTIIVKSSGNAIQEARANEAASQETTRSAWRMPAYPGSSDPWPSVLCCFSIGRCLGKLGGKRSGNGPETRFFGRLSSEIVLVGKASHRRGWFLWRKNLVSLHRGERLRWGKCWARIS
jgi:hypothetical protein